MAEKQHQKISASFHSLRTKIVALKSDCPLKSAKQMFEATVVSLTFFGVQLYGIDKEVDKIQLQFFSEFIWIVKVSTIRCTLYINWLYPTTYPSIWNCVTLSAENFSETNGEPLAPSTGHHHRDRQAPQNIVAPTDREILQR